MAKSTSVKKMSADQREDLLVALKMRFEDNPARHKGIEWERVEKRILGNESKLRSLQQMEDTGGEPDVVGFDKKTGEYIFYDCSEQTPKGRRSICYDGAALKSRKEHKPKTSAVEMATA